MATGTILTPVQIQEMKIGAKETFIEEFMIRYEEWLHDLNDLSDHDFGWKYGWQKSERTKNLKDSLAAVTVFQKYFYPARDYEKIEKEIGVERKLTWALACDGWLSELNRNRNRKTLYFISQQRAKEIWRQSHK